MHRTPRLALLLGGIAACSLSAVTALAYDPNKPSTTGTRDQDKTTSGTHQEDRTRPGMETGKATDTKTDTQKSEMGKTDEAAGSKIQSSLDRDLTDSELVNKIHAINAHEIDMAKLAEASAASKDVKDYAKKLIKDHQDADKKLTDTAKKLGIQVSTIGTDMERNNEHTSMAEKLKSYTGPDFDRHFLIAMQKGHDDAVLFLSAQVYAHPTAKELRDYVKKELGTMNDHRKKSIDLLEKMADRSPPTS